MSPAQIEAKLRSALQGPQGEEIGRLVLAHRHLPGRVVVAFAPGSPEHAAYIARLGTEFAAVMVTTLESARRDAAPNVMAAAEAHAAFGVPVIVQGWGCCLSVLARRPVAQA